MFEAQLRQILPVFFPDQDLTTLDFEGSVKEGPFSTRQRATAQVTVGDKPYALIVQSRKTRVSMKDVQTYDARLKPSEHDGQPFKSSGTNLPGAMTTLIVHTHQATT